jgi:hypothetical protein
MRPSISWDIKQVQANIDGPWDWHELSACPDITIDMVKANPGKPWNWRGLSCNEFGYDDSVFDRRYRAYYDELSEVFGFLQDY